MDRQVSTPAGIRVNTIVLAFTLVSGLVVFLRIFTRLVMTKSAGFEDVCIVFAMALSIALAVMISEQVMHGLGKHSSRLTAGKLDIFMKAFWASLWIYSLALTFIKVSILVQYLRIFPIRRFQNACFAILSFVVAYGAWTVFGNIFICNPIAFAWNKSIPDGFCLNQLVVWFTNAGVNIAQDVLILLLPIPIIRTLQIPKDQKKGLVSMFVLGASVTLVSVVRLYSLHRIANSPDVPFNNLTHATLSAVEVNIGIICACLPAMRPLLALFIPQYFSAASQYTDVPGLDIEHPKHLRTASASTGTNTARTRTPRPNTSRGNTPSGDASRQIPMVPMPILSRNPSGRFIATNSRSPTPGASASQGHSRSESNISTLSTIAPPVLSGRFQGRVNPLRMSPATFSPPLPGRLSAISPLAPSSHTRQPSDGTAGALTLVLSRTSAPGKPLPITPFPVSSGG